MILITCPNCGPRNSSEFAYFGETKPRPAVNQTDLAEWSSYLFMKRNPAGWTTEHWYHREGCRQFLVAERDTVTNEIRSTSIPGAGHGS
jgi:heterotetrameric sarcosine oxidase delta subunit